MLRSALLVLVLVACLALLKANSQTNLEHGADKPDYSTEPFIIEKDLTRITFNNDGTSRRDSSARIRIESDAALQQYGVLNFSYQSATENIKIDYVRVIRPD